MKAGDGHDVHGGSESIPRAVPAGGRRARPHLVGPLDPAARGGARPAAVASELGPPRRGSTAAGARASEEREELRRPRRRVKTVEQEKEVLRKATRPSPPGKARGGSRVPFVGERWPSARTRSLGQEILSPRVNCVDEGSRSTLTRPPWSALLWQHLTSQAHRPPSQSSVRPLGIKPYSAE